jgi:monoamine oxidase
MERHDVVVVGAGFAGLTAARELSRRGLDVLALEARDRVGGRTWTGPFGDLEVELGGAFVHWFQAHVWAELTRYGLGIERKTPLERAVWLVDGERHEADEAILWERLAEGMDGLSRGAADAFPFPVDPLAGGEAVEALDRLSVADRLAEIDVPRDAHVMVAGLASVLSNAPNDEAGLTQLLRAFALANHDAQLVDEINGVYTISGGTRALADAIARDGSHEVRTSTPVERIEQTSAGVRVSPREGDAVEASAAVIAVPINALRTIAFEPALPQDKASVAAEGQASRGAKVWIRTTATLDRALALTEEDRALPFVETYPLDGGGSLVLGFSPTNRALTPEGRADVATDLEALFPGAEVVDVGGHDWTGDPWSGGTWCCFRPGQMTRSLRALQRTDGRLVFAGGDIAEVWGAYIDGAIESGYTAAREAASLV